MSDVQITNGSVKYGETRKTGDFENKRADVELSFNIDETRDVNAQINAAIVATKQKCFEMLAGTIQVVATGTAVPSKLKPENLVSEALKKPPKMPTPAQASKTETQTADLNKQVTTSDVKVGGDLTEVKEPMAEQPKATNPQPDSVEITDATLMDATTKCQQQVKNAPAIRKLLNDLGVKVPPGRLIDLPQTKRAEYLTELSKIKPLA